MSSSQSMRPTGIPNIGNTCYIASAFQLLFVMDELVELVGEIEPRDVVNTIRRNTPDMLRRASRRIIDSEGIMLDIIDKGDDVERKLKLEHDYIKNLDTKSFFLENIADTGMVDMTGTGVVEFDNLLSSYDVLGELFAIIDGGEDMGHHNLEPVYMRACTLAPNQVYGTQQDAMETIHQLIDPLIEFYPRIKDLVSIVMVVVMEDGEAQFIDDTGPTKYKIANIVRDIGSINQAVDIPMRYDGRNLVSFIVRLGEQVEGGAHYIAFVKRDEQWYLIDDEHVQEVGENEIVETLPRAYVALYGR